MTIEQLIKSAIAKSTMMAATVVSSVVRPSYLPIGVAPNSVETAERMQKMRNDAFSKAEKVMRSLMSNGADKKDEESRSLLISNVMVVKKQFDEIVKSDPDSIASQIALKMCGSVPGMDDLGNQRRVVSTWSAIIAPNVVIRERDGIAITPTALVESAIMWMELGYTKEAKMAYERSDSRFIAAHPARMYDLLADTAHQMQFTDEQHAQLLFSMISPVLIPLASFEGSIAVLNDTDAEGNDRAQG